MEFAASVLALSRRDRPFVEFAWEFCGLAAGTEMHDAAILHLFRLGASYHHPMDLPDTTGLCWREGIFRCLGSFRSRVGTSSSMPPLVPSSSSERPESQRHPSAHVSRRIPLRPRSSQSPALLRLRWSRPALLRLRWSRPALLRLRWSRPALLRLQSPCWSRPALQSPCWPRPALQSPCWPRPALLSPCWPRPAPQSPCWPRPALQSPCWPRPALSGSPEYLLGNFPKKILGGDYPPWPPMLPAPPWPPESLDLPWLPELPAPPWPPESPDLPWLPELPAPPWPPELPAPPWLLERAPPWRPPVLSCVRVPWGLQSAHPPLPSRCYTARDAPIERGGVMSDFVLPVT